MTPWVAIQRNPISGSGRRRALLLDLIAELRRHGLRPRVFSRRERLAAALERPDRREGLVCIVAAGGDGTVGDVINRYPGVPLAVLPMGTENLFARYLRIPLSGRAVAGMIAAGRTRRVDLCALGERRFALMASCGFDADVVHRTHAARAGHISRFSYLQPIWHSVRAYEHPPMRLYLDDAPVPLTATLALLVNVPVYAMGLRIAPSALDNDGLVDLRLFDPRSAFQMLRVVYNVTSGRHERRADVQSARAARVRIESDVPVPVQVDGDPAGWTPAEVRVLPAALEVFVPGQ
jgi:diacylglycerol kinase (ATP)